MTTKIELLLPTLPTDVSGIVSNILAYNENVQSISCTTKTTPPKEISLQILARGGISRNPQSYRYTIVDKGNGGLPITYHFTPYAVHVDQSITVKENVLTLDAKIDMKPLIAAVKLLKAETDAYIEKGGDYDAITVNLFPPSKNGKRTTAAVATPRTKRARVAPITDEEEDYKAPEEE